MDDRYGSSTPKNAWDRSGSESDGWSLGLNSSYLRQLRNSTSIIQLSFVYWWSHAKGYEMIY